MFNSFTENYERQMLRKLVQTLIPDDKEKKVFFLYSFNELKTKQTQINLVTVFSTYYLF